MIRSPEPFFAVFLFAAIVSPVSSVFPSITVDAPSTVRQDRSVNSLNSTPMSHLTAWFDRRIIGLLPSDAIEKWPLEALWRHFLTSPGIQSNAADDPGEASGGGGAPPLQPSQLR